MILPLWTAMTRCKRSMRHLVHHESTSVPGLAGLGGMDEPDKLSTLARLARQHLPESHDFSRDDLTCTDDRTSGAPSFSLAPSVGTKRISVLISTDRWL